MALRPSWGQTRVPLWPSGRPWSGSRVSLWPSGRPGGGSRVPLWPSGRPWSGARVSLWPVEHKALPRTASGVDRRRKRKRVSSTERTASAGRFACRSPHALVAPAMFVRRKPPARFVAKRSSARSKRPGNTYTVCRAPCWSSGAWSPWRPPRGAASRAPRSRSTVHPPHSKMPRRKRPRHPRRATRPSPCKLRMLGRSLLHRRQRTELLRAFCRRPRMCRKRSRELERRIGFRTEDFAGLASIARSDDDGYDPWKSPTGGSRIRGGATTRGDAKPAKSDGIQPIRCSRLIVRERHVLRRPPQRGRAPRWRRRIRTPVRRGCSRGCRPRRAPCPRGPRSLRGPARRQS